MNALREGSRSDAGQEDCVQLILEIRSNTIEKYKQIDRVIAYPVVWHGGKISRGIQGGVAPWSEGGGLWPAREGEAELTWLPKHIKMHIKTQHSGAAPDAILGKGYPGTGDLRQQKDEAPSEADGVDAASLQAGRPSRMRRRNHWGEEEVKMRRSMIVLLFAFMAIGLLVMMAARVVVAQEVTITGTVNELKQIEADDGEVYSIGKSDQGQALKSLVGKRVEVTGIVEEGYGGAFVITVNSYKEIE
jgi:hypothetical protein